MTPHFNFVTNYTFEDGALDPTVYFAYFDGDNYQVMTGEYFEDLRTTTELSIEDVKSKLSNKEWIKNFDKEVV